MSKVQTKREETMAIDMTVKPVAVVAFILTCLGCVQSSIPIFLTSWWTLGYSDGSVAHFGVWSREVCSAGGRCLAKSGMELTGGQEALFVSKVFASLGAFLSVLAVVAQLIYFCIRRSMVRTAAIFAAGSACVFGLLGVFIFVGYYSSQSDETSLGVAFYLYLVGTILCGVAAGFTLWASVKKASDY